MSVHALDVFIENATKMVCIILLSRKNEDQPIQYNGNYWCRQGMGIMHLDVLDPFFHSGDAWDSMP